MKDKELFSIDGLSVSFFLNKEEKKILHDISYNLHENEILGIVGESGSGKSISALSILGLLPKNISEITSGTITFEGEDLVNLSNKSFQNIRGRKISMIFQEPMSALNPSMTCGKQVFEILERHTSLSKKELIEETLSLFRKSKISSTSTCL